eukprot:2784614-Karenia_brevis.AAC.1
MSCYAGSTTRILSSYFSIRPLSSLGGCLLGLMASGKAIQYLAHLRLHIWCEIMPSAAFATDLGN